MHSVKPRTRKVRPRSQAGADPGEAAMAGKGLMITPGLAISSPGRRQKPFSVVRVLTKYSIRLPRPAMFGPVPALKAPRLD